MGGREVVDKFNGIGVRGRSHLQERGRRVVGLGHSRSIERCRTEGKVAVASILGGGTKRLEKSGSVGYWGCTK